MIVRIFGPPGTGKTYMLNRIVYHLIGVENNSALLGEYGLQLPFRAYKMSQIAYISFMNSAVDELLNRLGVKRNYRNGPWGTLHGLALHLLIRDKLVPKELVANTFAGRGGLYYWRRKFTYEVGIPYDPQEEVRTLLGNQLFDALSYAVNVYYPKYEDMSRVLDKLYDITDNPELVQYAEAWERFKVQNKIIDFDDILVLTYTARPTLDAPVLVVDEFQDFGPLQYEIFKAWAEGRDLVFVAGDDDQCLVKGTKILTPSGEVPIEDIQVGDKVITSIGGQALGVSRVRAKIAHKERRRFVKLTLEDGRELTVTDDHLLFVHVPTGGTNTEVGEKIYLYVMENTNGCWRIGISSWPFERALHERQVTRMYILEAFDTLEEARFAEEYYSLKYGIPQGTFMCHDYPKEDRYGQILCGEVLDRLCAKLNVSKRVKGLLKEFHINERYPHFVPKATVRGRTRRININLKMLVNDHGRPKHILSIETSDKEVIDLLRRWGLNPRPGRKPGVMRIRRSSTNIRKLEKMAKFLSTLTGGTIVVRSTISGKVGNGVSRANLVLPAGHVFEGMYLPVVEDGEVYLRKIVKREVFWDEVEFYDLEIERTHNFVANGIIVHNCVTEYNGSRPDFLVELPGLGSDFDVVLKQSFRIPQVVHEASQRFIKTYVRYRYPKKFLPRDAQGIFVVLKQPLPHILRFVKKVAQSGQSVLILARTNALVRDIERMLLTEGIEYHRYKARVTQVWRDFINRIHAVVRVVKAGKKVRETDLRFFFRFTRVPEEKVNAIAKAFASGNVPLEAYRIFDDPLKVLDFGRVAEFLGSQEKADMALRALKALLDGRVQRPKAPIYLDTIHAAKGREADVVVLFDTITPRIFDGIRQDRGSFESEMRVWYVGMTRARKALVVVPLDIPLALPLLRKAGFSSMKVLA